MAKRTSLEKLITKRDNLIKLAGLYASTLEYTLNKIEELERSIKEQEEMTNGTKSVS